MQYYDQAVHEMCRDHEGKLGARLLRLGPIIQYVFAQLFA